MIKGLIDMSYDKDAFAITILTIFKLQFAKNHDFSTITFRIGIWKLFITISFSITNNKANRYGIS
jgi:hypothetical protein